MTDEGSVLAEERVRLVPSAQAIDDLHAALDRFWAADAAQSAPDPRWRHEVTSSIVEIGTNIVHHAIPAGATATPIELCLWSYPDRVEARFLDRGLPYLAPLGSPATGTDDEQASAADRTGDVDDVPESGFGLAIARAALDTLDYHRSGRGTNVWHLVKRRSPSRGGG
jgi:anti-sigma regulatory factor (Ser/Thr protein kinase)